MKRIGKWMAIAGAGFVVLLLVLRPADKGAGYGSYFAQLNRSLHQAGIARPVLVLDLDQLDHNIDLVKSFTQGGQRYRAVAKSLPSIPLLRYLLDRVGNRRLMAFHEPFVEELVQAFPDSDILIGKPMPVAAAKRFYGGLATQGSFEPWRQLQWLVDSPARLDQYQALARARGITLAINIEIDVGLHRGGLSKPADVLAVLSRIAADPAHLRLSGFMGYDAHASAAPALFDKVAAVRVEVQKVRQRYEAFVDMGRQNFPKLFEGKLTYNGAGSKTYKFYKDDTLINDVAAGTGLVKPTDYDFPTLDDHLPALYIATPVLKKLPGGVMPFVEFLAPLWRWWDPNRQIAYFTYSGGWRASYVAPAGLENNPVYGYSTNQAMVNGSQKTALNVDDFVFLRPAQSEKTMLEFGDLVVVRGGQIVDRWPVMRP